MKHKDKWPVFFSPQGFLKQARRRLSRRAQTLVEYALILAVISIVAIGVLINLQKDVRRIYTSINNQLILSAASGSH